MVALVARTRLRFVPLVASVLLARTPLVLLRGFGVRVLVASLPCWIRRERTTFAVRAALHVVAKIW